MSDEKPNLSMGAGQSQADKAKSPRSLSRNEAVKRVSELEKELEKVDERAAGQEMREAELREKELILEEREKELAALANVNAAATMNAEPMGQLPPRVSADEGTLKEHSQAAINSRQLRDPIEMGKKFPDITPYLQKYEGMQLMWINDRDGDVQRWLDHGAELVPVEVNRTKIFEGFNDGHSFKWVRIVGGETAAGVYHVYLLMIEKSEYDRIKLAPVRNRQMLIAQAMAYGVDQSGTGDDDKGFKTYAPNLPGGHQGLEQLREVAGKIPGQ